MARLSIGNDAGGPYLKMTSDAYDPATEPDGNYSNFRFNSHHAEIGYFDEILVDGSPSNYSSTSGEFSSFRVAISASYSYPSIYDFYLTDGGGWNYPQWWRSINTTFGQAGGNEWGSVAYAELPINYPVPTRQVLSTQGYLNGYTCKFIISDLPVDATTPLPFAEATQVPGQQLFDVTSSNIRLARKGYDTRTADADHLIIGGNAKTMPVYMSRRVNISASQLLSIPLPSWVPANAIVLMQWNVIGQARRLPSIWVGGSGTGEQKEIRWKITGGNLVIQNLAPYSYNVVFFVVSQQVSDPLGGPAFREGTQDGEKFIRIVQGNGVVAADTRWSYMPIIKSGVLPFGGGQYSVSTTFPNQGYIPFVWYSYCYRDVLTINGSVQQYDRYIGPRHITNRYNVTDYLTNTATVYSSSVIFQNTSYSGYLLGKLRDTLAGRTSVSIPLFIRYYVFAVPDVQA